MKEIVNKPVISKWIGRMYIFSSILTLVLFAAVTAGSNIMNGPVYSKILFFGIMISVLFMMIGLTFSLYKTKYAIQDGVLYSWSPFAIIKLKIKDIKKVERILIPFHFRIGASFYCGRFYIPNLGWTKSIITNLNHGVLITAKNNKHYLITPSSPDKFARLLKSK